MLASTLAHSYYANPLFTWAISSLCLSHLEELPKGISLTAGGAGRSHNPAPYRAHLSNLSSGSSYICIPSEWHLLLLIRRLAILQHRGPPSCPLCRWGLLLSTFWCFGELVTFKVCQELWDFMTCKWCLMMNEKGWVTGKKLPFYSPEYIPFLCTESDFWMSFLNTIHKLAWKWQ